MEKIILGLGSNLGDRLANLKEAKERLALKLEILSESSIYESEPFGNLDQNWFLNQCVAIKTILSPRELLDFCKEVEKEMGREKTSRWGPRNIDVDILLYGDREISEEDLVIPHLGFTLRKFVLLPYSDLEPEKAKTLLRECKDMSIVRLYKSKSDEL